MKYACRLCDQAYEARLQLTTHIRWGHVPHIMCPICGEFFPNPKLLEAHKTQPHITRYSCKPCNLKFTKNELLYTHNRFHHDIVKCAKCPETMLKKEVKKHMLDVHKEAVCGVCGYIARSPAYIETHQRKVHMKEKNVTCSVCKFQCYNMYELRRHMISHKVDRVYTCKFCKKTFPRKTTCKIHEMIHTGEKNKKCEVCDAAFVQKASLNYHMLKYHPDHV